MADRGFYVPVLTTLVLAAFVLLVRFFPDVSSWAVCEPSRCTVQDWLTALSGWAAFAGAAIGIVYVASQLKEQRKQTAFLIGDADPTFEISMAASLNKSCMFRIVNWNRRNLVIQELYIASTSKVPEVAGVTRRTAEKQITYKFDKAGMLENWPQVRGWHNRQKRPRMMEFYLLFPEERAGPFDVSLEAKAEVIVRGFFNGDKHRETELRLSASLHHVVPNDWNVRD